MSTEERPNNCSCVLVMSVHAWQEIERKG